MQAVVQFTYLQVTDVSGTDRFEEFRVGLWFHGSNGSFDNDELIENTSAGIESFFNSSSYCRVGVAFNGFNAAELVFVISRNALMKENTFSSLNIKTTYIAL